MSAAHRLTEYGTTDCPVEHVRANVDDGECSACGEFVGPVLPDALVRMREAFKREHHWRMEVTARAEAAEREIGHLRAEIRGWQAAASAKGGVE